MNEKIITPEEFEERMLKIQKKLETDPWIDEEETHGEMDQLMEDVLRSLGYGAGCDIFDNTPKWYA